MGLGDRSIKERSASEKALDTIEISRRDMKHAPKEWPFCQQARRRKQRHVRNTRILRDYLAAQDKPAEIARLCEAWGLSIGRVEGIIEKMQGEGAPIKAMAAEVEVLRQQKREQILSDGEEYRVELEGQIEELEQLRSDGKTWAMVEETDEGIRLKGKNVPEGKEDTTAKNTKTKKLPINTIILKLKQEVLRSHDLESDSITVYTPKPKQDIDLNVLRGVTDEDLQKQLEQLGYKKENGS